MPERPAVSLIAAVTRDGGIGANGELLVRIPDDLKRFKALTLGAPVVMGRKTWASIGRALPGRRNLVVSRDPSFAAEGAEAVPSLAAALAGAGDVERVWVIGGSSLFAEALPIADSLELTEIDAERPADAWFPAWDRERFERVAGEPRTTADGVAYRFVTYRRRA